MPNTPKSTTVRDAILAAGVALSAVVGTYNVTRDDVQEVVASRPTREVTDERRTTIAQAWTRAAPEAPMSCRPVTTGPYAGQCYCREPLPGQAGVHLPESVVPDCEGEVWVDGGRVYEGERVEAEEVEQER